MAVAGIGAAVGAIHGPLHEPMVVSAAAQESDYTSLNSSASSPADILKGETKVATIAATRTTTATQWKISSSNTITISPATGYYLSAIRFTTTSTKTYMPAGTYSIDGGSATAYSMQASTDETLSGLSINSSIVLSLTSEARISKVYVTFDTAGTSHSLTYAIGDHGSYDGASTKSFSITEDGGHTVLSPSTVGISASGAYVFNGWNDGTGDYAVGSTYTMGKSDVTLTAQWVAGVGLSYSSASASGTGTGSPIATTYVVSGGTQIVAPCTFTAPSGKQFSHWNTASDDSGASYDPYDEIDGFTSALTLYAIWETLPTYNRVEDDAGLEIGATYFIGGTTDTSNTAKSYIALTTIASNVMSPSERLASTLGSSYSTALPSGAFAFTLLDAGKDASENQLYYLTRLDPVDGLYHSLTRTALKKVAWNSNDNNTTNAFTSDKIIKWKISVDADDFTVTIQPSGGDSGERILLNYNSGSPRFTTYSSSTSATMCLPFLYKTSGSLFKTSALSFATTYLKMGNSHYDGDVNEEDNPAEACASNYSAMKTAYSGLNAFVKNVFLSSSDATLYGARERAKAWAIANGQTFTVSTGVFSAVIVNSTGFSTSTDSSLPLIITIAASVGLLTAGGAFLIARRRRDQE